MCHKIIHSTHSLAQQQLQSIKIQKQKEGKNHKKLVLGHTKHANFFWKKDRKTNLNVRANLMHERDEKSFC